MKPDDFDRFRDLVAGVHGFYSREVSPFALDVWWNALRAYDLPVIAQAFSLHCVNPDTGQFCPKPADVVRMVGGTTRDAALMAWAKVGEAVSRAGAYRSVCFDDPIINRVLLELGGWPDLCRKPAAELPFIERAFCDRYRAYRLRGASVPHPPYLVGICEATNALRGYRSEPPMLIGSPAIAQAVLASGADVPLIPVTVAARLPAPQGARA